MVWLGLLGGLAGTGEAAVGSGRLDSAALSTVVQGSPGRSGRHGEFVVGRDWRELNKNEQERTGTELPGNFSASRDPLADPLASQSQPENWEPPCNEEDEDKAAIIIN
jgi:hypothetical protein